MALRRLLFSILGSFPALKKLDAQSCDQNAEQHKERDAILTRTPMITGRRPVPAGISAIVVTKLPAALATKRPPALALGRGMITQIPVKWCCVCEMVLCMMRQPQTMLLLVQTPLAS